MKVSDFTITTRQAFAFLVPGTMLLFSLAFFCVNLKALIAITTGSPGRVLFCLASGLLLGVLVRNLLMNGSAIISPALNNYASDIWLKLTSPNIREFDRKGKSKLELARLVKEAMARTGNSRDYLITLDKPRLLFKTCKHLILESTRELGNSLLEREAEINLFGLLPLPVLLLGIALGIRSPEFSSMLKISTLTCIGCLALTVITLELLLLSKFKWLQDEEEIETFRIFMDITLSPRTPEIKMAPADAEPKEH